MLQSPERNITFRLSKAIGKVAKRQKSIASAGRAIAGVYSIYSITSDQTVVDSDHTILANAVGGAIDIFLLSAADVFLNDAGQVFVFKKIDATANTVDIIADGAETIDGSGTYTLTTQYESVMIQSDGSNWYVI